jgi:hypothetical protein
MQVRQPTRPQKPALTHFLLPVKYCLFVKAQKNECGSKKLKLPIFVPVGLSSQWILYLDNYFL